MRISFVGTCTKCAGSAMIRGGAGLRERIEEEYTRFWPSGVSSMGVDAGFSSSTKVSEGDIVKDPSDEVEFPRSPCL